MGKYNRLAFFRHLTYCLLLILLHTLDTTPRLFELFGGKPTLVLPAALAIAMCEGEFVGGLYGAFAGLLMDSSAFSLFGFNAFFLLAACVGAGLLVSNLVRNTAATNIFFSLVVTLLLTNLRFLFVFGIYRYDGVWPVYLRQVLLTSLYTALSAAPVFLLTRGIFRRFQRAKARLNQ